MFVLCQHVHGLHDYREHDMMSASEDSETLEAKAKELNEEDAKRTMQELGGKRWISILDDPDKPLISTRYFVLEVPTWPSISMCEW